jgi:hypothetical protein
MNATSKAGDDLKSLRATIRPVVSGSRKSGADVPIGNMVDSVNMADSSLSMEI